LLIISQCRYPPLHENPFPLNPTLQSHVNLPYRSVHFAFESHKLTAVVGEQSANKTG